jgi:hypothetical protein
VGRKLLVLNVLLGSVSLFCVAFIVQELVFPPPGPSARPRPPAAAGGAAAATPAALRPPAAAYNIVATRNVFSPTRTETTEAPGGGAALAVVKPNLHGVVLRDVNPIAYLEDPLTKRVAGYRIGDQIAGGTVKTIAADLVVIARPEGTIDVRLRDPSKPRPAPPAAAPGAPGVTPPGGVPGVPPGVVPPRVPIQQPQVTPGVPPQLSPFFPGRRPSPSFGSRLPPTRPSDVPPQPQQ